MAFVGPMENAFGGKWFDMDWNPQLTFEPWKKAVNYYVENMKVDTKGGLHGVGQPPGQGLTARLVHDGDRVQKATGRRDISQVRAPLDRERGTWLGRSITRSRDRKG